MRGETASIDGDGLTPFQGVVLDADSNRFFARTAESSERTRKLCALADVPASLRAYAGNSRYSDRWGREHNRRPLDGNSPVVIVVGMRG